MKQFTRWIAVPMGLLALSLPGALASAADEKPASNKAGPVTLETIPAMTALVLPVRGSFDQMPEAIGKLMGYAGPKNIIRGAPFGVYYDDPGKVPPDSLRWEIAVPVPAGTKADAPFVVHELAEMRAAVVMCAGPWEGVAPCYGALSDWLAKSEYQMAGPAQEHWLSDPQKVPPAQYQTRIVFPVSKKQTQQP